MQVVRLGLVRLLSKHIAALDLTRSQECRQKELLRRSRSSSETAFCSRNTNSERTNRDEW